LATDQVRQALGLHEVPDHTTLYRTYRRMRLPLLDQLRQALLADLKPEEDVLAADATCYQLTNASEYFLTRRGHPRREWRKRIYAVGTQTQLILAWRQSSRPGNDARFLNGLRRDARRYGRYVKHQRAWTLLADTGFDGRGVQANDVIPPMRRHGKITAPERCAQADRVAAARLDGLFGQRWKTDIAFREDECRIRKGAGDPNFAVLRHIALNLLKQVKTAKIAIKAKRLKAGWDEAYLCRVLAAA